MSRSRRLLPLLLLTGLGCSPDGPVDFYRETLQARSEMTDTLAFIVDEPTAAQHFPPAYKILKRRTDLVRDSFEAWDKKAEVRNGFDKVMRDGYKPSDIGNERKQDMIEALMAYEDFCKNLVYVNARLGREVKRLELVLQASIAKKAESGDKASSTDFPALSSAVNSLWSLRELQPPRIFSQNMTTEFLKRFAAGKFNSKDERADEKAMDFVTTFVPSDIFAPQDKLELPPPPTPPAFVGSAVDKLAERIAKIPSQLPGGITAAYEDEHPRPQKLKNETGKTLKNVSGFLIMKTGAQQADRWVPITVPEWKTEPVPMPVVAADNPTNMRIIFEAEIEGAGPVGYDQRLPNPPPPRKLN